MEEPTSKPRSRNYALWFIGFMLVVILFCGACAFLSVFTDVGRAFWQGFNRGLGF